MAFPVPELSPMVVRPSLSILKTVVVAKAAVELLTVKRALVPPGAPATDNLLQGEVVPMPRLVPSKTKPAVSVKPVAPESVWIIRLAVNED